MFSWYPFQWGSITGDLWNNWPISISERNLGGGLWAQANIGALGSLSGLSDRKGLSSHKGHKGPLWGALKTIFFAKRKLNPTFSILGQLCIDKCVVGKLRDFFTFVISIFIFDLEKDIPKGFSTIKIVLNSIGKEDALSCIYFNHYLKVSVILPIMLFSHH